MKITIKENEQQSETEIIIHCKKNDEEIQKLVSILSNHDRKLNVIKDKKTFILEADDVLYFDSVDKRTFVYTKQDVYEIHLRLYELEEQLPQNFFRASKSAIINIDKIKSILPDFGGRLEVTLISGERLLVSRQYAHKLKIKLEM